VFEGWGLVKKGVEGRVGRGVNRGGICVAQETTRPKDASKNAGCVSIPGGTIWKNKDIELAAVSFKKSAREGRKQKRKAKKMFTIGTDRCDRNGEVFEFVGWGEAE